MNKLMTLIASCAALTLVAGCDGNGSGGAQSSENEYYVSFEYGGTATTLTLGPDGADGKAFGSMDESYVGVFASEEAFPRADFDPYTWALLGFTSENVSCGRFLSLGFAPGSQGGQAYGWLMLEDGLLSLQPSVTVTLAGDAVMEGTFEGDGIANGRFRVPRRDDFTWE